MIAILTCIAAFEVILLSKEIKYASCNVFCHKDEWEKVAT